MYTESYLILHENDIYSIYFSIQWCIQHSYNFRGIKKYIISFTQNNTRNVFFSTSFKMKMFWNSKIIASNYFYKSESSFHNPKYIFLMILYPNFLFLPVKNYIFLRIHYNLFMHPCLCVNGYAIVIHSLSQNRFFKKKYLVYFSLSEWNAGQYFWFRMALKGFIIKWQYSKIKIAKNN